MDNTVEDPSHPVAEPPPPPESGDISTSTRGTEPQRWLWQGKIGPAFWTIACLFSITVNVILIVLLVIIGKQVFAMRDLLADQFIGGLYQNFVLMDEARISTTIQVHDEIPVKFDLPVVTNTTVILTDDTRIRGVRINLRTGGLSITDASANIVLPAGTELPIALNIVVPVSNTVPVNLTVPVDIPLNQTELHEPFVGLQNVVSPYAQLMTSLPTSWSEMQLCDGWRSRLCARLFGDD